MAIPFLVVHLSLLNFALRHLLLLRTNHFHSAALTYTCFSIQAQAFCKFLSMNSLNSYTLHNINLIKATLLVWVFVAFFFFFVIFYFFLLLLFSLHALAFMNELHWLKILKLNSFAGAVCAHLFIYSCEKACDVRLLLLLFVFYIFFFEVSYFLWKKYISSKFLLFFHLRSSSTFSVRSEFSHFKHGNPPQLLEFKEFSSSMSTARSLKLAIWDFIFLLFTAYRSLLVVVE